MESINQDDEDVEETEDHNGGQDDDIIATPRRKRVSELVRLTGKPKTPQMSHTRRSRVKGKVTERSDADHTRQIDNIEKNTSTGTRKQRCQWAKPKSNNKAIAIAEQTGRLMIPDSDGEEKDVWISSSNEG